jgi:hypothetical protein
MALTTQLTAQIAAELTQTVGLVNAVLSIKGETVTSLASGTGSSQADKIYQAQRTLSASATEDLDLAGVLTDIFGAAITFAKVKAIYIKAASGNTNNVVVGGASATQFVAGFGAATHTFAIPPGGFLFVSAPVSGWTVGAGSADLLKVANSGGGTSVTYDIVVVGTSA